MKIAFPPKLKRITKFLILVGKADYADYLINRWKKFERKVLINERAMVRASCCSCSDVLSSGV